MSLDKVNFVLTEILKTLGLAFLGLLAVKAIHNLRGGSEESKAKLVGFVRALLYAATIAIAALGALSVGGDVAAGIHEWAAESDLDRHDLSLAYANALRAVELRPGVLDYWRTLAQVKLVGQEYASLLKDEPAIQALGGGDLRESDAYHFAVCHFSLGQYDETLAITHRLISRDRYYAAPYIIEGMAYVAQKKYADGAHTYLDVLQIFPNQQAAVEGLAQVYFLMGETGRALDVLNDTSKYPFTPEARKRFESLKVLYAQ